MVVLLGLSCRYSPLQVTLESSVDLEPTGALLFKTPVVAIARDGASVLLLEASGTRILRVDAGLSQVDTLPLSDRLLVPRGVAADRFYVYCYDERVLYRMLKGRLLLQAWLSNARVTGLAGYAPGEMLVSDAERATVWHKAMFGESREFYGPGDVQSPGPLVALPDDQFCLLDAGRRLLFFNRAGIVERRLDLSDGFDVLVADDSGRVLLGNQGVPAFLVQGPVKEVLGLRGVGALAGAAAADGWLFVLDGDRRLVRFALP